MVIGRLYRGIQVGVFVQLPGVIDCCEVNYLKRALDQVTHCAQMKDPMSVVLDALYSERHRQIKRTTGFQDLCEIEEGS